MDKIKFAQLIAYISSQQNELSDENVVRQIDRMITEGMPQQEPIKALQADVDKLLHIMCTGETGYGGSKIEAIKAYRALTSAGLKESKDAVEKYWVNKPMSINDGERKMTTYADGKRGKSSGMANNCEQDEGA